MSILESVLLQSGVALYADSHRQPDGQFVAESGQVPHYESGILSAYPSPANFDVGQTLLYTPPAPASGYEVDQNILTFDFLNGNFTQPGKVVNNNTVSYLAPYIHYYPKEEVVVTPIGTQTVYSPIKISALNFVAVPVLREEFYTYQEPVEEED